MKIEETKMKMKNDERRDEDEDGRGACTVWVRLRPSCLACRGFKPGDRLFLERGVVALYLYSLGEVRYVELSVLVNVKSKPTIVSAGFQKYLAECTRPGPFAAWCRMCVCACDLEMVCSEVMGLEWAPS